MKDPIIKRVWRRMLLELDVFLWKRSTKNFRVKILPPSQKNKVTLFCDLMAMIAGVKSQALFARGLAVEGHRIIVLLMSSDSIIQRYYRGVIPNVEFVFFQNYMPSEDEIDQLDIDALLDQFRKDSNALINYELSGVRVGRNALSLAIRQLRTGRLCLDDSIHLKTTRDALSLSVRSAIAAKKLISEIRPYRALFNERGYTPAGEVFDACLLSGCHAFQWIGAPSSDELIFKRYTIENRSQHPLSLNAVTWEKITEIKWNGQKSRNVINLINANYRENAGYNRQKLQEGKKILTREEVVKALELDPSRKTAVIFTHILYDATFFYGESLFDDYQQWLVEVVRAAIQNKSLNWIIKVHPVNVWRSKMDNAPLEQLEALVLEAEFGNLPDHIKIMPADTPVNTGSLFQVLDYGLTVRGTVGMELPCLGVPVITAGTGRYSGHGFTIDPKSREEFAELLSRLHLVDSLSEADIEKAQKYYYATMKLRPIKLQVLKLNYEAHTYGLKDFSVDCHIMDKNCLGKDMKRLCEWMSEDSAVDLMGDWDGQTNQSTQIGGRIF
ncbi:MAG: hypothetical protein VX620_16320 [Pseudomonadota bacterium]|nr:hypothetical protein [Pseudomonadota bacterium]